MKILTRDELAGKLDYVWWIKPKMEDGVVSCVGCCDVLPLIKEAIAANTESSQTYLQSTFTSNPERLKNTKDFYGETNGGAHESAYADCVYLGAITFRAFEFSESKSLTLKIFEDICQELCTGLGIDDSDEAINPAYWERAHADELSPLEAVCQSQD